MDLEKSNHDSKKCSEFLKLEEQYSELMFNYKILLKENNELKRNISLISIQESKLEGNAHINLLSTYTQTETVTKELRDIGTITLESNITSEQVDVNNDYSTRYNEYKVLSLSIR